MKLIKKLMIAVPLIFVLCCGWVMAENNVSEIDIDVTIHNDGSASIVQNWHGVFDIGTENYIPIATEDISVSNFTVSDQNGEYTFIDNWDIDASFDDKAEKCGINKTADGVELCFGISNYGENRYSIGYKVKDFIKSYTDFDGTNFMFINPNMSTFPTNGSIKITMENDIALNEENSAIWAFGYNGNIEFINGAVWAKTSEMLRGSESMIVMLRFNKGIIFPETVVGTSFENVKNKAFEGSDYLYTEEYEDVGILETVIGFIILFSIPAVVVLIIVFLMKRKKEIKKFYKQANYFRDVPNRGNIDVSHYLAQNFDMAKEESLIIGALMLSMINKKVLEPQLEESVGFFGKTKESVNLKLLKQPDTQSEQALYELLSESAGEDGILQEKELERYSYRHPKKINKFIDDVRKNGENDFVAQSGFVSGAGNSIKDLSDSGKAELSEIMGLKKYLEDFTLIAERGIAESEIWKEYMIYATLFGISERIIKQLKRVYPEKIPEIDNYNRNVIIASSYYHSMYRSSQRAIQEKRMSGGGGLASLGGGSGFSGGGSGGGSR